MPTRPNTNVATPFRRQSVRPDPQSRRGSSYSAYGPAPTRERHDYRDRDYRDRDNRNGEYRDREVREPPARERDYRGVDSNGESSSASSYNQTYDPNHPALHPQEYSPPSTPT